MSAQPSASVVSAPVEYEFGLVPIPLCKTTRSSPDGTGQGTLARPAVKPRQLDELTPTQSTGPAGTGTRGFEQQPTRNLIAEVMREVTCVADDTQRQLVKESHSLARASQAIVIGKPAHSTATLPQALSRALGRYSPYPRLRTCDACRKLHEMLADGMLPDQSESLGALTQGCAQIEGQTNALRLKDS